MNNKFFLWLYLLLSYSTHVSAINIGTLNRMSLEELMQVPVTGSTLTDESLKTVPSAVTVFTREQIEQMGFNYLHELLDLVPGYQTQRVIESPTLYSYSARGRRNGSQSKEVLLLLDGRILNNPRIGSSNPVMINLAQIERVEVIRGPGSALYGSGAYNGVINVVTRKNTNEIELEIGSLNRIATQMLGSKKGDSWQADIYVQAARDQGQSYNVDDNFNPNPTVRFNTRDPMQSANLDLSLRYQNTSLHASHRQQRTKDFYVIETLRNNFNQSYHEVDQINLEQEIHWSDAIRSNLILAWEQTTQHLDTQATAPGVLAPISRPSSREPLLGKARLAGRYWQFKWHNDWQLGNQNSAQFGLEWLDNQETEANADNNFNGEQLATAHFPIDYYGNFEHSSPIGLLNSRRALGIYGQYLYNLTHEMKLTLGLRYDNYLSIGTRLSPRVGWVYSPSNNHTLKLLYGEAFRAPTLDETSLINNPLILGNPILQHEVVKTWDVIWLTHTKNAYFSLGWFLNHYENPISTKIVSGNIRTFANMENSRSQGLELEASHQLNGNWLFRGTFTHFTQLPDTALREADTLASLLINYERDRWNWNLTGVYHGSRAMLTGTTVQTLDAHWLFNSKLRYRFNKSWSGYAQVKNLADKNYQTAPQGNRLTEGVPNRGREGSIGIEYRF
ncbi:MAG: TonB-dependent receptor [Thiotrichaceae bacterium]